MLSFAISNSLHSTQPRKLTQLGNFTQFRKFTQPVVSHGPVGLYSMYLLQQWFPAMSPSLHTSNSFLTVTNRASFTVSVVVTFTFTVPWSLTKLKFPLLAECYASIQVPFKKSKEKLSHGSSFLVDSCRLWCHMHFVYILNYDTTWFTFCNTQCNVSTW